MSCALSSSADGAAAGADPALASASLASVLGIPFLPSQILQFITLRESNAVRATCADGAAAVRAHRWDDLATALDAQPGRLAAWRAAFPRAIAANLDSGAPRGALTAAELAALAGGALPLRRLDLHGLPVSDAQLVALVARSPGLAHLDIGNTTLLSAAGCAAALRAAGGSLRTALLMRTAVDDEALALLAGAEYVDLSGCQAVSDVGLAALGAAAPRLARLTLRGCARVTGVGIAAAGGALRTLDAQGCAQLRDDGAWPAALRSLASLTLTGAAIGDAGLAALARAAGPRLRSLALSQCCGVRDAGLAALLAAAPRLEQLALSGCHNYSGAALLHGARCGMDTIRVADCPQLSEEELRALRERARTVFSSSPARICA